MRLLTIAATVLACVLAGAPAAASPDPALPGEPTTTWSGTPTGGASTLAQVCVGYFGGINREYDGSRYYIHWGGWQQCSPNPAVQSLTIHLYMFNDDEQWELADVVSLYSPSTYVLTAFENSPRCLNTSTTIYYMKPWGAANGVNLSPRPAYSPSKNLTCELPL